MNKIYTNNAPEAIGPYSQAVECGGLIYTSGQIAINPESGQIESNDIKGQTTQVMKNLTAVLEAAGSSVDKAIKTVCFLADMNDFAAFNSVYGKYFPENPPARSCVQVASLPMGLKVEVEMIAVKG